MTAVLTTLGLSAGFWLAAAAATSATVSLSWRLLRRRVAAWHPTDRESLLWLLTTAPSAIPTALSLVLLAPGIAGLAFPAFDHCTSHPHHPHLCLAHPSAALPASLTCLLLVGAVALSLAARAAHRTWRELREVSALWRLARQAPGSLAAVIDSGIPFALTVGLTRRHTLVSSALVDAIDADQLAIVLAHEAEHARRRDPLRQVLARWLSVPLWPSLRRALLRELELSAEQACDEAAARGDGNRLAVAETILKIERLRAAVVGSERLAGASIAGSAVPQRVAALLHETPPRRFRSWVWGSAALALGLALGARPFHHESEHLIARILGLH